MYCPICGKLMRREKTVRHTTLYRCPYCQFASVKRYEESESEAESGRTKKPDEGSGT